MSLVLLLALKCKIKRDNDLMLLFKNLLKFVTINFNNLPVVIFVILLIFKSQKENIYCLFGVFKKKQVVYTFVKSKSILLIFKLNFLYKIKTFNLFLLIIFFL